MHKFGRNKKSSHFFGHPYAILISSLVVGAGVYSMYVTGSNAHTDAAPDPDSVDTYINSGTLVLSNEFNYGFGKDAKPDGYVKDVSVTVPKFQSVDVDLNAETVKEAEVTLATIVQPNIPLITRPRIAIIIDDMGVRQNMTEPFAALSEKINFSFLPYAQGLAWQTKLMRENGHELMLHLPMEPSVENQNPGPKALLTNMSDDDLLQRLNWNLAQFEGFVGINNHMGSLFTQNPQMMATVVERLKQDGLFFIDSRTTSNSYGYNIAKDHGIRYQDRDVFIDNELSQEAIFKQLTQLEDIANKTGVAIAIGHPHPETLEALQNWLPSLKQKGIDIVKVSTVLKLNGQLVDHQLVDVLTTDNASSNPTLSGGGN